MILAPDWTEYLPASESMLVCGVRNPPGVGFDFRSGVSYRIIKLISTNASVIPYYSENSLQRHGLLWEILSL